MFRKIYKPLKRLIVELKPKVKPLTVKGSNQPYFDHVWA